MTADISKAFLQIGLREADRDVHRFLWIHEGRKRVMRFRRVTFGVSSSPFLLNATIRHHLSLYPPSPAVKEMSSNFYVDDLNSRRLRQWRTGESEGIGRDVECR